MATLTVRVPREISWSTAHRLRLRVGSEGASSLSASTPAGGMVVAEVRPWQDLQPAGLGLGALGSESLGFPSEGPGLGEGELGYGALGLDEQPRVALSADLRPVDRLARLPVGVDVVDGAGNVSAVVEQLVELSDVPAGVRDAQISAGASAGMARVTWTRSSNVV